MSTLDVIAQEHPRYAGACYALMRCLSSEVVDSNTRYLVLALQPEPMWHLVELIVQRCATVRDVEAHLPELVREVIE